jgi:CheY-like chemotaxis protein
MMADSRRARIAVINDDTAFLSLMRELLQEEESYDVLICKEWDHAYEFIKREHPDLLILDIRIGGEEHGWTILNLLTLDPETRPIPTIVCSAAIQSLHEHQPTLTKFGIRALPKPFDLDTLLEAIERMIGDSAPGDGDATPPES